MWVSEAVRTIPGIILYENVLERILNTQEKLSQPRAFYVCVGSGSRAHDARLPGHHILAQEKTRK